MNIAIVGSRNYPDLEQVERFVHSIARKYPHASIISGGAKGVDGAAERAAAAARLRVVSYRPVKMKSGWEVGVHETNEPKRYIIWPKYASFGQAAFARNRNIVESADIVVAFTTGSKGTANSISIARELGKRVFIYEAAS